jgi:hypothetical protein
MTHMMTQPYLMNHHKTLYFQLLKLDSSFKLSNVQSLQDGHSII